MQLVRDTEQDLAGARRQLANMSRRLEREEESRKKEKEDAWVQSRHTG